MENCKRNLVKIIYEICEEAKIDVKSYSYDWIFKLSKNNKSQYILGYKFGLNAASVDAICGDKSAASAIMTSLGISNVEHSFYMSPANQKYIGNISNWSSLIE